MRESMTYLYAHFVWATWDRLPLLVGERKAEVYRLIKAECRRMKADVIAIGGIEDHMHLLIDYPATITVADVAKRVKGSSSYITQCNQGDFFQWQGAYAAFTVSRRELTIVRNYIENQERHHRQGTTLNEYEII